MAVKFQSSSEKLAECKVLLGRSQNLGIAKKEGGSDPCQDFFGGFDILYRG